MNLLPFIPVGSPQVPEVGRCAVRWSLVHHPALVHHAAAVKQLEHVLRGPLQAAQRQHLPDLHVLPQHAQALERDGAVVRAAQEVKQEDLKEGGKWK